MVWKCLCYYKLEITPSTHFWKKAMKWDHFRNCLYILLVKWILSILSFSKKSSLKPISHSSPLHTEEKSDGVFVLFPLIRGPSEQNQSLPLADSWLQCPKVAKFVQRLNDSFLKGFEYHIKHDLRAIITRYVVFILGFTCLSWVLLKCKSIILPQAFTFSSQNQQ